MHHSYIDMLRYCSLIWAEVKRSEHKCLTASILLAGASGIFVYGFYTLLWIPKNKKNQTCCFVVAWANQQF